MVMFVFVLFFCPGADCNVLWGLTWFAPGLFVTTLVSINHWRSFSLQGLRRKMDLIVARVVFTVYSLIGYNHVPFTELCIICVPIWLACIFCYYKSVQLHHVPNNNVWWKWHFALHLLMTIGLFIILAYCKQTPTLI